MKEPNLKPESEKSEENPKMADENLILQRDAVKSQVEQMKTCMKKLEADPKHATMTKLQVLSQNLDKFYEEYNQAYDGILQSCEPAELGTLDEEYEEFEQIFYETCVTIERLKEQVESQTEPDANSPQKPKRKKHASSPLSFFNSKVCAIPNFIPNPSNAATIDPLESRASPSDEELSQCSGRTFVDRADHIPEVRVDQLRSNPGQTVVADNSKPLQRKPSPLPIQSKHADAQTPSAAALQQPSTTKELAKPNVCNLSRAGVPISCQVPCPMSRSTVSPEVSSSATSVRIEESRLVVQRPSEMSESNLQKIRTEPTEKCSPGIRTSPERDVASKPQSQASNEESDGATSGSCPEYESRSESAVSQPYPPKITLQIQLVKDGQEKSPVTAAQLETRSHPTIQKPSCTTSVPVKVVCPVETTPRINQEDERAIQLRTEPINLVMVPFQKQNPVPEYTAPSLKQKKPPDIIQAIVGTEHKPSTNQHQSRYPTLTENACKGSKKLLRPREAKWRFQSPRALEQRTRSAKPDLNHIVLEPVPSSRTEHPRKSD